MAEKERKQIQAITLRKQVADALREAILSGELRPGEKLREVDLANRFGVSRNPIREAIGELEQQGLIVARPNRGKTVVSPTNEDLRQAYQVRACLELLALRLAWEHITDRRLAKMRQLVELMKKTTHDQTLSHVARHGRLNILDAQFHQLLIEATENKTLIRAWKTASPWALGFIRDLERERIEERIGNWIVKDPHEDLMNALEQKNLDLAEQALITHLSRSWLPPAESQEALDTATHITSLLFSLED